ncbi:MAG: AI-2E family transporter [Elusimicrobiota bacterium]
MQRLTTKTTLLTIAALVSMIGALYLWREIFLPFVVSILFAYLLSPLVVRIQSFGLKREVAVVLLYLCFIAVFVGALLILLHY